MQQQIRATQENVNIWNSTIGLAATQQDKQAAIQVRDTMQARLNSLRGQLSTIQKKLQKEQTELKIKLKTT